MRAIFLTIAFALTGAAHAQPPSNSQSELIGEWRGTGYQVGPDGPQSNWTISLTIAPGVTSQIEYASLGCKGELHQLSRSGDEIEFREQITEGDCITRGRVIVRYRENRILWFWYAPKTGESASAVLYRNGLSS